jgi:hypothetical protein
MHAPGCNKPESVRLLMLNKVGEPPDHPQHNIGYDHDLVEICPACNAATLERLRHDCFDFEAVWDQHEWYELSPEDGARMREVAARCDRPLDPFCKCGVHASLKASALALPGSSWDAVFESAAHRHVITLVDGPEPAFSLVTRGAATPMASPATAPAVSKESAPGKPHDLKTILFVCVVWPLVFIGSLVAWFRAVDWPLLVDALFVAVMLPVSFVLAGVLTATLGMAWDSRRKPND